MTDKPLAPLVQFKRDLATLKEKGELDMLPKNVSFEAFRNAAVVAITDNPGILGCKRESLFRAIRKLAAAGLVPDGREAALVPFKGEAQAMPMVFGLIKTARNSGEIRNLYAEVVYSEETFRVWFESGERKFEHEYNPLARSGDIVGAYAVVKLKDGTIDFEAMGLDEIEKRRKASANQKGDQPTGIWQAWYPEMAKKTVIRALCKRLPVSSEDMRRIMVEDEPLLKDVTPQEGPPKARKPLSQQIMEEEAPETEKAPDPAPGEAPDTIEGEAVEKVQIGTLDIKKAFPGAKEWAEGAMAYAEGKVMWDCPYEDDEEKARDWCGGWANAQSQDAA